MTERPDIGTIFREGSAIDAALVRAAIAARREHKQAGRPMPAWVGGRVVWIPAEEIDVDGLDEQVVRRTDAA